MVGLSSFAFALPLFIAISVRARLTGSLFGRADAPDTCGPMASTSQVHLTLSRSLTQGHIWDSHGQICSKTPLSSARTLTG